MAILCRNFQIYSTKQTVKDFLLNCPEGVYTTARCSIKKQTDTISYMVFDLNTHLDRLINGANDLFPKLTQELGKDENVSKSHVCLQIKHNMFLVADQLHRNDSKMESCRLTVWVTCSKTLDESSIEYIQSYAPNGDLSEEDILKFTTRNDRKFSCIENIDVNGEIIEIMCFGEALPNPPTSGISVVCRKFTRSNPTIKNSDFVAQRDIFEKTKSSCNDSLLVSNTSHETQVILEGCSSNFFAVYKGGVVRTASDEMVLAGTIRKLVCNIMNVEHKPPDLSDIEIWDACCITSTSRLVLPIRDVIIPDDFSIVESVDQVLDILSSSDYAPNTENNENQVFKIFVDGLSSKSDKIGYTVIRFPSENELLQELCGEVNKRILSSSSAL